MRFLVGLVVGAAAGAVASRILRSGRPSSAPIAATPPEPAAPSGSGRVIVDISGAPDDRG